MCAFQPDTQFTTDDKVDLHVNKTRKLWSYARMLWRNNPTSRHPAIQSLKEQFVKPAGKDEGPAGKDERPAGKNERPAGKDERPEGNESESDSSDISSGFWDTLRVSEEDRQVGRRTLGFEPLYEQDYDEEGDYDYDPANEPHPHALEEGGESESEVSDPEFVDPNYVYDPEAMKLAKPKIEDETSDWDIEGVPELPADEEKHRKMARELLRSSELWPRPVSERFRKSFCALMFLG